MPVRARVEEWLLGQWTTKEETPLYPNAVVAEQRGLEIARNLWRSGAQGVRVTVVVESVVLEKLR